MGLVDMAVAAPDLVRQPAQDTGADRLTDSFHLNLTAFGLLSFAVGILLFTAPSRWPLSNDGHGAHIGARLGCRSERWWADDRGTGAVCAGCRRDWRRLGICDCGDVAAQCRGNLARALRRIGGRDVTASRGLVAVGHGDRGGRHRVRGVRGALDHRPYAAFVKRATPRLGGCVGCHRAMAVGGHCRGVVCGWGRGRDLGSGAHPWVRAFWPVF